MPNQTDQRASSRRRRRVPQWISWLLGVAVVACFIVLAVLTARVFFGLEQQRTANSDNIQWTLTQVEVEHLGLLNAIERHLRDPQGDLPPSTDFAPLRRSFDVFYSRVDTLANASLYAILRAEPGFPERLAKVTTFLEQAVPLIDGSDDALQAAIVPLWRGAQDIRGTVRELSLLGLAHFASSSDAQRSHTTMILAQLALLSAALLIVLAIVSVYLLLTNRGMRRHRDALRQTNDRMNTVLSTALDGVIVSDAEGLVLDFNPAAEVIFGYSAEEALGQCIGELIVPPALRDAHSAGMKRMKAGGERRVVGQGRVQLEGMRKGGEIFPVELALQSAFSGDDEIIIGFLRDISEAVAAESELISARDRALAGEQAKTDFLTVMSHEIRTPLNGLLGNLSLLKNMQPSREQKQIIQNMDLSGQVLLNHVDTVLDIARFEAGKLSVHREKVDLGTLVQEIVDGQSGNAASRGNTIEWQWLGQAAPWVAVDAQRLRQVLLNLVGNAIKFAENGRVSIEVEVVEPGEAGQKPVYEFRVIDTGVGIAEEDHGRIFEDFHTHDPSIGRTAGGTGLGLGIARRFTEAMGGEIGVESTPGEGSLFWVRLPLEMVDPGASATDMGEEDNRVRDLDLLVVEDNEVNLAVICKMLEMDGHKVTVARDGKSGVAAAEGHRFDAILMDISMPIMDGPTATRKIRAGTGKSADVPILAVSANVLPQAVKGFREAGMTSFVGKPLALSTLRAALVALMEEGEQGLARQPDTGAGQEAAWKTMQADLGEAAFGRFLGRFASEADAYLARLGELPSESENLEDLAMEGHRLAGSAAMFGLLDLRDIMIEIEMAALAGQQDTVVALGKRAGQEWASARSGLPLA